MFTVDYALRFYVAGVEEPKHRGFVGRLRFICTFFSLVDLVSIVPFYLDFAIAGNLPASQFLRMFRLLRMMKVEGRYIEAFTLIDDVAREQKSVLGTAMFVGASTWVICAAFYYVAEHRSKLAIYCGGASNRLMSSNGLCPRPSEVDLNACTFDEWGFVNCTKGGCAGDEIEPHPCWNLFQSIPGAAFFTLLNLFGEFPLIDQHSFFGKIVGTIVAVFAVAVFAIPAGILGNGFEDLLSRRREEKEKEKEEKEKKKEKKEREETEEKEVKQQEQQKKKMSSDGVEDGVGLSSMTISGEQQLFTDQSRGEEGKNNISSFSFVSKKALSGRTYLFLSGDTTVGRWFEGLVLFLIVLTTVTFAAETTDVVEKNVQLVTIIEYVELFAVVVFTLEYIARYWSTVASDPKYTSVTTSRAMYLHGTSFFGLVDLLSILPYWLDFASNVTSGQSPFTSNSTSSTFVRCLRLLRILRAEKYTQAFTVFDDVLAANSEVLIVTGFSALVMWILFSALMYFFERNNNDPAMREFYNTVPNAMWITLLNLSGEAPLCHYTGWGKILLGIIGVFATGFFGIPIGLLGAGFEEWIEANDEEAKKDDNYESEKRSIQNGYDNDGYGEREEEGIGGEGKKSLSGGGERSKTSSHLSDFDEDGLELNPSRHSNAVGTLHRPGWRRGGGSPFGMVQRESTMELLGRFLDPMVDVEGRGAIIEEGDVENSSFNTGVSGGVMMTTTERRRRTRQPPPSWCFGCLEIAFDSVIFFFIGLTVALGCLETVDTFKCDGVQDKGTAPCGVFLSLEWIAVVIFTLEYMARFIVAPYTPGALAAQRKDPGTCATLYPRLSFFFSFYSIIDLLAILPFYLATSMPGGWVDQNDEYFRMLRLFRLLKLDKYVPSITLIDDVFRLKRHALLVTGFVSVTLWILFSALQYLTEYQDVSNFINPVPDYGCNDNCTMSDRFSSVVATATYTLVHLTGDYPIVTYSLWGRIVCFFMVLVAVGVVSIPSGLIASGFAQVVRSKATVRNRAKGVGVDDEEAERRERLHSQSVGDGYFERKYAELDGVEPPSGCCCCFFGQDDRESSRSSQLDLLQFRVNTFLNGRVILTNASTQETTVVRTMPSELLRYLILFLIVTNVIAVVVETVPSVDRYVGNAPGNFFDVFELVSVIVFASEYALRMFSVIKDREHLYSMWFYATTFFGIVDLLAFAPYMVEQIMMSLGWIHRSGDAATVFRLFRIFRILQLEHFVVAFTVLDNVFRASKDVLKATGLMALIIWIGCGAVFFIAEQNNPNWRTCDSDVPLTSKFDDGCYDFVSTADCNVRWPGKCQQVGFVNMPDSLYYTAVFLGGEWGKIDFTTVGRLNCIFLCVAGIAIYAIPVGTLFDSFGAVLGMGGDDDEEDDNDDE